MSVPITVTASGQITLKRHGRLKGMFIAAAASTPTLKITTGQSGTPAAAVKATQTLTVSGEIAAGEKVTVGLAHPRTYTFVEALSSPARPDEVLLGASTAEALDNLKSAINASAGEGTTYSTGTTAHLDVTATTNTDTTQVVQAVLGGLDGNLIAVSKTMANGSWGAAVLAGGLPAVTEVIPSFTPVAGVTHNFGEDGLDFEDGIYATIGNTVTVTLFVD